MDKSTKPQGKNGYAGVGGAGDVLPEGKTAPVPPDTLFHKYVAIQRRCLGKEALATLVDRMVLDLKRIVRKRDSADKRGG